MIYLYKCEKCDKVNQVDKPMAESSREEKCDSCKQTMNRIFTASSIKTSDGIKS